VAVLSDPANAVETLMANTTNAGTRLIEEGALLPESLRFESEPWTSFYIAGEIIRESRKALENKKVNVLSLQRKVT
jgi:hypothetical protein